MATVSNDESNISYNPQDWLALSGKKLERYYYKSQNSTTFKLPSKKSAKKSKTNKVSKSSGDCPPMINPEEIKITLFEYPKDENYTPQRPTIKHIQSVNPYLTATNMLDALKLVIEGKEKSKTSSTTSTSASTPNDIEAAEQEVTRLTQQKMQLEKEIDALEKQLESGPQSGGGKFRVRDVLKEEIADKKRQLKQVNIALASAMQKLEELKLKDTKSQMATSSSTTNSKPPPSYEATVKTSSTPAKASDLKSGLSSKASDLKSSLSSKVPGFSSKASGLKSSFSSKTSGLKSSFSSKTSGLKSSFSSKTSGLKSSFSSKASGLSSKVPSFKNPATKANYLKKSSQN